MSTATPQPAKAALVTTSTVTGLDSLVPTKGLLRFSTAGSVDDGKSTLIGRLLYDSKSVFDDQIASVRASKVNRSSGLIDFSLLTDGYFDPEDCFVECPLHAARFDIRSGAALEGPATEAIPTYGVKIEDGAILVDHA